MIEPVDDAGRMCASLSRFIDYILDPDNAQQLREQVAGPSLYAALKRLMTAASFAPEDRDEAELDAAHQQALAALAEAERPLMCTCIPGTRRALDPDCPLHRSAARARFVPEVQR